MRLRIEKVEINGKSIPFTQEGDYLNLELNVTDNNSNKQATEAKEED